MTTVEVLVLIIGIIICVVAFIIPDKKSVDGEGQGAVSEERIKELVNTQMKDAKGQMQEMVDETVSYSVEKAERAMERLTNEKISAVSEFSDTVLEDINKNRDEVMFLYDMLNDKHENLKETAARVSITTKEANEVKEALDVTLKESLTVQSEVVEEEKTEVKKASCEDETDGFEPFDKTSMEKIEVTEDMLLKPDIQPEQEKQIPEEPQQETDIQSTPDIQKTADVQNTPDIQFDDNQDEQLNNNERILELHRMKKSNVAIAKELGLGVGEVKLVIDLYKGM